MLKIFKLLTKKVTTNHPNALPVDMKTNCFYTYPSKNMPPIISDRGKEVFLPHVLREDVTYHYEELFNNGAFTERSFHFYLIPPDVIFYKSNPPHIGWWYTKKEKTTEGFSYVGWRWWNGLKWSWICQENCSPALMEDLTGRVDSDEIKWSFVWPINGRVPRINFETGIVTGKIKKHD